MAKKQRTFVVNAWITVCVGINLQAKSFEDAAKKAALLEEKDFIDIRGEFTEGRGVQIAWISDNDAEPRG